MGFTTGFTGGVTLTLSVAYFTVLTHQQNRQRQCRILRANTGVLRALTMSDPTAVARLAEPTMTDFSLPPAVTAQQYYHLGPIPSAPRPRPSFVDELKNRWNAEIEGVVRKVQHTDWVEVRENAEEAVSRLWKQVFASGGSFEPAAAAVKERAASVTEAVKAEAKDLQASVSAAGAHAAASAQTKASEAVAAVKSTAGQVVLKSKDALVVESAKAQQTGNTAASKASDKASVELALQQRYAKTQEEALQKKSVNELLDARYKQRT